VSGNVRFDEYAQSLYAPDGSVDQTRPVAPDGAEYERPVAPGASCRTQLGDREGADRLPRPLERLREAPAHNDCCRYAPGRPHAVVRSIR
jgi:hypothetical protein